MRLPAPRGHTSAALITLLGAAPPRTPALLVSSGTRPVQVDDDLQLALWICYELHYRGFDDAHPAWEGHSALAQFHAALEARWEAGLRQLKDVTSAPVRPETNAQRAEWERHQAFWLPRRGFRALPDIQGDAYGGVQDERMYSVLFTVALRDLGDDAGVDDVPAVTLALANALSLFGTHKRLVGALAGFLTAVDTMAGDPYSQLAAGAFPAEDVLFGFGACHSLHARLCAHAATAWSAGRSSLRGRWLPLPDRINVGC